MAGIALSVVSESTLPGCNSATELCEPARERGRCELLPPLSKRVSKWSSGSFRKAGAPVPGWWEDDPLVPVRPVELYRLADTWFFPAGGAIVSSRGEAMEAACDEMRSGVPDRSLSQLPRTRIVDGIARFRPPLLAPKLERAIVTMPWGATFNYGHFLLDCLTGVTATLAVPELRDWPYVFPQLTAWQRRHLALAGVDSPRVLLRRVYRVAQVFHTSCMAHNLAWPNVHFLALRDRQLARLQPSQAGGAERIYISRRGARQRVFVDEAELESRLESLGFTVVQPELLSVDDQIATFNRARVIVGPTGAAFANVLYCKSETVVVEIVPAQMAGQWVSWLCALNGAHWRPWYCEGRSAADWAVQRDLSFSVDIGQLIEHIAGAMAG